MALLTQSVILAWLASMLLTFKNLNVPISLPKTEGPFPVIQFLGIILDTNSMEARLPQDKLERIQTALDFFQQIKSNTLQEMQSLIGTLNFACKVIASGRPFLQRMIQLKKGVSKPHHHIKLNSGSTKTLKCGDFLSNSGMG